MLTARKQDRLASAGKTTAKKSNTNQKVFHSTVNYCAVALDSDNNPTAGNTIEYGKYALAYDFLSCDRQAFSHYVEEVTSRPNVARSLGLIDWFPKRDPADPTHTHHLMVHSTDERQFTWHVPLIYLGRNKDNTAANRRAAATKFVTFANSSFVHAMEKPLPSGKLMTNNYSIGMDTTPVQDPGFAHAANFFVMEDVLDIMKHHHDTEDEMALLHNDELMQLYFGDETLIDQAREAHNVNDAPPHQDAAGDDDDIVQFLNNL
jgi:hypothetical protein